MEEAERGEYTPQEFSQGLKDAIVGLIGSSDVASKEKPIAYLLGGQSGAGKTMLHQVLRKSLADDVIVINGDEYRSFHPRYRELDALCGAECVKYTAPWAGKMTEALIDAMSTMGYNLVVEGTLRTKAAPMKTARLLRERGYSVSIACMAVKPEISLVSCQIRYHKMRLAGTVPRATDPEHHNAIVHDLVCNVSELEDCGLFDEVCLYERSGKRLYPGGDCRSEESASSILRKVLFGPWSWQEKAHYRHLKGILSELENQ